jgi:tetratricopeptide (TPR) repeat protein
MADEKKNNTTEDDIVIETGDSNSPEEENSNEPKKKKIDFSKITNTLNKAKNTSQEFVSQNTRNILTYLIYALVLILIIVIVYILFQQIKDENKEKEKALIDASKLEEAKKVGFIDTKETQVEEMIRKANLLYSQGNKIQALRLFEEIATYNASLSYYNLGVARLKKNDYKEALKAFDQAIINKEHICVSAINAAVCSQSLNEPHKVKAYLDLAYQYLPEELDSPLYGYYYSLIHFYKKNYLESLSALEHQTSNYFSEYKNMMKSRVYLHFENYKKSANSLTKGLEENDKVNLGLLYAKNGELELAKKTLLEALETTDLTKIKTQKEKNLHMNHEYSVALVDLKLGNIHEAGSRLHEIFSKYESNVTETWDIDLSLKDSLFDVQEAQKAFAKEVELDRLTNAQVLFYFAPYKVFDAKNTISLIRKGSSTIFYDDISEATKYLSKGAKYSDTNKYILLAMKEIVNKRIRNANRILREVADANPKHAILHYNLGLTYAQLGDMASANQHFIRSYHLNARDYPSGIFALITGKLIGKNMEQLSEVVVENLSLENNSELTNFHNALIDFNNDNFPALNKWIEHLTKEQQKDTFYLALALVSSAILDKEKQTKEFSDKLLEQLPSDLLVHLLHMYSYFKDMPIKEFSKEVINYFQSENYFRENANKALYDFYYGARVTQEMFIQFHLLTGYLEPLQTKLEHQLSIELDNPEGILQALALTQLFNNSYEIAYNNYNRLIEEHNVKDSRTLFLGGIAGIASKHYANAIALFELARLKNSRNMETRYGLGLLYLEAKNFAAAGIQYKKFDKTYFNSHFFNFNVVHKYNHENAKE